MQTIKEVIIVEGKDDAANIKHFVDAEIIITHGFGLSKQILKNIQYAAETIGIIIFTDPDFAGEQIRKKIVRHVTGQIKHAYISQSEGTKKGNIGVENANQKAVVEALLNAKVVFVDKKPIYTMTDMYQLRLIGDAYAKARRLALGDFFRIGYGNGKQILARLNKYNIDKLKLKAFLTEYDIKLNNKE